MFNTAGTYVSPQGIMNFGQKWIWTVSHQTPAEHDVANVVFPANLIECLKEIPDNCSLPAIQAVLAGQTLEVSRRRGESLRMAVIKTDNHEITIIMIIKINKLTLGYLPQPCFMVYELIFRWLSWFFRFSISFFGLRLRKTLGDLIENTKTLSRNVVIPDARVIPSR